VTNLNTAQRLFLLSLIPLQSACVSSSGTGKQAGVYQPQPAIHNRSQTATNQNNNRHRNNQQQTNRPQQQQQNNSHIYRPTIRRPSNAANLSPAVVALVSKADQYSNAGNLVAASAQLERAMIIQPRQPTLIHKLASLRLKQSQPKLAEELARKSILLAQHNNALKRQNWLLISEARKRQHDFAGADQALINARKLRYNIQY